VLAGDFTLTQAIRFYSRLRLNSDGLGLDYLETGANFSLSRVSGYISYLQEAQAPDGLKVQSLDLHGETFLTKHWGVSAYAIIDGGAWRRRDFGVIYRDSCIRVEVLYRHDETFNGTLGPSTSVLLRLSLATLGNTH
jgi:LPS-assembly protein